MSSIFTLGLQVLSQRLKIVSIELETVTINPLMNNWEKVQGIYKAHVEINQLRADLHRLDELQAEYRLIEREAYELIQGKDGTDKD